MGSLVEYLSIYAAMHTYVDVSSLLSAGSLPYSPCETCAVFQGNINTSSVPYENHRIAAIGFTITFSKLVSHAVKF